MKIKDILNESYTDLVAHCYVDANEEVDRGYNPEASHYADTTREYYEQFFKEFFKSGEVPIFEIEKDSKDKWSTRPVDEQKSPGRRGIEKIKKITKRK